MSDQKLGLVNWEEEKAVNWARVCLGTIVVLAIFLTGFFVGMWRMAAYNHAKQMAATQELQATHNEVEHQTATQVQQEAPQVEEAAEAPQAVSATKCKFARPDRPKVEEKYILTCSEGQFLAIGTHNGEGYDWSDFEAYTPN